MAQETQQANQFVLSGGGTRVRYESSTISGAPRLAYVDANGDEHVFTGDDIASAETALGTEITATLEAIPDLHVITFTLVLPEVSVSGYGQDAAIGAIGVVTTRETAITGPGEGPAERYDVTVLEGAASAVQS
jgi:hypothetical protein